MKSDTVAKEKNNGGTDNEGENGKDGWKEDPTNADGAMWATENKDFLLQFGVTLFFIVQVLDTLTAGLIDHALAVFIRIGAVMLENRKVKYEVNWIKTGTKECKYLSENSHTTLQFVGTLLKVATVDGRQTGQVADDVSLEKVLPILAQLVVNFLFEDGVLFDGKRGLIAIGDRLVWRTGSRFAQDDEYQNGQKKRSEIWMKVCHFVRLSE